MISVCKRYHSDKHFSEFYLQDGGKKINWHRYETKLRHCHPMYTLPACGMTALGAFAAVRRVRGPVLLPASGLRHSCSSAVLQGDRHTDGHRTAAVFKLF